jgi:hypothetical protein
MKHMILYQNIVNNHLKYYKMKKLYYTKVKLLISDYQFTSFNVCINLKPFCN